MIEFRGVHKSFGPKTVLDGLDLRVPRGRITFIVGKSGEGKSVTIKHIMGLLKPDSGRILIAGDDITDWDRHQLRDHRRRFGMLFQMAALFDSMTVGENIMFPLQEHSDMSLPAMLDRVQETLEQVGLPGIVHKYPAELSTGERKRVGLARALVTRPSILLYDEPTTGMDPLVSEMIDELIVKVNRDVPDMTSVVISHDLKAALATADTIAMLYKGKLALMGTPDDFRQSVDPVVRQFFAGRVDGPIEFV